MQELTKAQKEYFKDSQIRDREGNLIVCHHLTSAEFDAFDKSKIGVHNSFYGHGFYFSTSDKYDEDFGKEFRGVFGHIRMQCYLDIQKPLVLDDLDMLEVEEIMEYMRDNHPDYGKPDGPLPIAIGQSELKNMPEGALTIYHWRDWEKCGGEMQIFKVGGWDAYSEQLANYAKENGYDGIVQHPLGLGKSTEIVVFEPNQIKLTSNLYPTKSDNYKDNSREYLAEHEKDLSVEERCKISKHISDIEKQNRAKQLEKEKAKNNKEER